MAVEYVDFIRKWNSLIEKSTNGVYIDIKENGNPQHAALGEPYLKYAEMTVYRAENGLVLKSPDPSAPVELVVSRDYSHITAYLPPCVENRRQEEKFKFLVKTALETAFPFRNTVSLHSACVDFNGVAIAFTGPSGVGKSTRARAWVENLHAAFISGDRPAVRLEKNGVIACGVPWDGKEQIFTTTETPLFAILEVRRAPFQAIRKLTAMQARRLLMQQCMVPMWDQEAAVAVASVVRRLIDRVPVYRLFCGPDHMSADWTRQILFADEASNRILEPSQDIKVKDEFVLQVTAGEPSVTAENKNGSRPEGKFVLNQASAAIWEMLRAPIAREDVLSLILAEFDVSRAVAEADLEHFLSALQKYDMLENFDRDTRE